MDPAQAFEAREIARNRIINETIARGDSPVQQFYAGAVVLLTGGSGFLGKQLLEKLFRSCNIKKMFILLRTKKKKSIEERMTELLNDPVYEHLHEIQPDFVNKILPVAGDVTKPRLGISDNDWKAITEEVTIIFHGAATISFVEPLKKATLTNVCGTREILLLARECSKLRSYVQISTAYSHATLDLLDKPVQEQFYDSPISPEALIAMVQGTDETILDQVTPQSLDLLDKPVQEQFYDSPISPEALIAMVQGTDETILDQVTPQLIKGWPNTYAYTKAVAEEAVRVMAGELPVCIVRPAIVICAYREPAPGWIDRSCAYGPSGFVLGAGVGVLRVLYASNETKLDLVPVDLVNNAVILAAQETAVRHDRGDRDVKIYTVTGTKNPLLFGKLIETVSLEGRALSTNMMLWYGYCIVASNKIMYSILSFFLHWVPGYLIDGLLLLFRQKPILTKVYKKASQLNGVLGYYMTTTWNFGDSNLRQLYWSQSPADRTVFNCDTDSIDWTLYIVLWCLGCRKYIIKDGLKDTEKGNRKQFWLKYLNYIVMVLYAYAIYKIAFIFVGALFYIFNLVFCTSLPS